MKHALALPALMAALMLALMAAVSCATAPLRDPAAMVSLEKGGCGYIAACPAYVISMKPDGSYSYLGYRNVPVIGVRQGKLSKGAWAQAEAAFIAAGWDTLEDPIQREGGFPCMPDSPFARVTPTMSATNEKVFSYNLGCNSKGGDVIIAMLDKILLKPEQ